MKDQSPGFSERELVEVTERGERQVERLLEKSFAFEYKGVLDTRGFRLGGPEVFLLRYAGADKGFPSGMGKWPTNLDAGTEATYSFGPWVDEPEEGHEIAIKMRSLGDQIAIERAAMLRANHLFPSDQSARPVRLYGYGIGETFKPMFGEEEVGYLLQELIPSGFISYKEAMKTSDSMDADEAFDFVLSFAGVVNTMHRAGIAHGDLEDTGHKEHVYWDSQSRHMRIIDWTHADLEAFKDGIGKGKISLDQTGIEEIMRDLLGKHTVAPEAKTLLEKIYEDIDTKNVVFAEDDEYKVMGKSDGYPLSAEGTQQLYDDLVKLKELALK